MATLSDTLLILVNNPIDVFEETCRLLVKIADNILKDPSNLKIRTLNKTNQTIRNKIMTVPGGIECLRLMGFQEDDQLFRLGLEAPLNKLEKVKTEIEKFNGKPTASPVNAVAAEPQPPISSGAVPKTNMVQPTTPTKPTTIPPEVVKKVILPPFTPVNDNPFLKEVERRFHLALKYENSGLQARARRVIPVEQLEVKAQNRLRSLQEDVKKGKMKDPEVDLQDMLILELLSWFKTDFFTWMDNPDCTSCGGATKFSHMSQDKEVLIYTDRVEMHNCNTCKTMTPFPRYSDLNILLETRKGRCGEWANTFTLLCMAMGWDARHVVDETDHVWTEVFSHSQKRWLHCDPCENACNTPLMYETGWNKTLSYVIAYSGEEVQDVTWRYTGDHAGILKRRDKCSEQELALALIKMRERRQKEFSKARREYLTKRLLNELVELMIERKPSDKEQQDRISGSLGWRMERGEAHGDLKEMSHIWVFNKSDLEDDCLTVKYSSSSDSYHVCKRDSEVRKVAGWQNGAFSHSGVFRKVENDWKMAYICRQENNAIGSLCWKFLIEDETKVIDNIEVTLQQKTFEKGIVKILLTNGVVSEEFSSEGGHKTMKAFSGSTQFVISVDLLGEVNNNSWQHAQLFRQSLESEGYPFIVSFTFREKND